MWTDTRRRLGALAVDSFFRGAARAGSLHPDAKPARHGVEKLADVAYLPGGNPAHLLDIYRPVDPGPHPVVLYVHGGGFRILSKDTHWLMALAFARRGYVVFTINYRLSGEAPYPAAIDDVCDAYLWVREHAADYGGDPDHIVLAGESAGANLVAALTTALCWRHERAARVFDAGTAPAAVIPACGIFQVSDVERLVRRKPNMRPFVRDRLVEVSEAYLGSDMKPGDPALDLADPVVFLERGLAPERPLPPFFLPVGTRDPLLPDTRRMHAALAALGADVEVRYYPGELHAFHAFVFREPARACWEHTWAFLDRVTPRREAASSGPRTSRSGG
jgi:acetyl esterase